MVIYAKKLLKQQKFCSISANCLLVTENNAKIEPCLYREEGGVSRIGGLIIRVIENGEKKYLFNRRLLVYDPALAKKFSSELLARRYWRKSSYTGLAHTLIPDPCEPILPKNLGSIVE